MGNKPPQSRSKNSSSSHLERELYENMVSEFGDRFLHSFKECMNDLKSHQAELLSKQHPSNDVGPCKVEERFQHLIFPLPEIKMSSNKK